MKQFAAETFFSHVFCNLKVTDVQWMTVYDEMQCRWYVTILRLQRVLKSATAAWFFKHDSILTQRWKGKKKAKFRAYQNFQY